MLRNNFAIECVLRGTSLPTATTCSRQPMTENGLALCCPIIGVRARAHVRSPTDSTMQVPSRLSPAASVMSNRPNGSCLCYTSIAASSAIRVDLVCVVVDSHQQWRSRPTAPMRSYLNQPIPPAPTKPMPTASMEAILVRARKWVLSETRPYGNASPPARHRSAMMNSPRQSNTYRPRPRAYSSPETCSCSLPRAAVDMVIRSTAIRKQ